MISTTSNCNLVGCPKQSYQGFPTCGRTHGKIYNAIQIQNTNGTIEFYDKQRSYYELTNFYENYRHGNLIPIHYQGQDYKTSEHAFQYTKFNYSNHNAQTVANKILNAATARDAFKIAQKNQGLIHRNWTNMKDNVMYEVVKSKFTTSSRHLRNVLLGTGNAYLVETSPYDGYWGYGHNKQGENKLGKILMRVREEIKQGII